jgi:DNA invertase Pin-like site-specific DNA recombinase
MSGRPVLESMLTMLREEDKLVVWRLDRLARNMRDLLHIVHDIELKGATLEILDQRIDTGTAGGKAFLQMLGVFAEFETNLRRERQMAGIKKAKAQGKYQGRKPSFDKQQILELLAEGRSYRDIARTLGCSKKTVQRARKADAPS